MTPTEQHNTFPKVSAVVRVDGSAEVTIQGTSYPIDTTTLEQGRAQTLAFIAERAAQQVQRPVQAEVRDPSGSWTLLVHPDGKVEEVDSCQAEPNPQHESVEPVVEPPKAAPEVSLLVQSADQSPMPAEAPAASRGRHAAPTLNDLLATRPGAPAGPAEWGWQGTVRRLTGGLVKPTPGRLEIAHRDAVSSVQRSLHGPKTVAVVNPKGGAHKTTATFMLAATFGIHRGGYTLAWDNNETRGTLGWRANQARHSNTAVDLLGELERFTGTTSMVGDLDNFVRAQGSTQFDVLASDEDAASAASIDDVAFNDLHAALKKFYRVIVVDTGNNMRASNWRAAIEAADQLVIVSTVREDTAQSAAWLVDALSVNGYDDMLAQAVTILSAPATKPDETLSKRLHDHFNQATRAVVDVPYDQALVPGGPIVYEALSPRTREAWLHATAAVANGL